MSDPGHIPGQVESEFPDEVVEEAPAPAKDAPEPEKKVEEPEKKEPEDEDKEPDADPEKDKEPAAAPQPQPEKKRSIYDDLKERKNEAKGFKQVAIAALKAQGIEVQGTETFDQLQALLTKKDEAITPKEKSEAKDAIDRWAEQQDIDPKALRELTDIIKSQLPTQEGVLTPEEAAEWRQERSQRRVEQENQAIRQEAPAVRKQLEELGTKVHDETEFNAVMEEIVALSHTKEFHDKEIGYIVWMNREKLSKMISPKKSSFEAGGQNVDTVPEGDVDFSQGGLTPGQVQSGLREKRASSLEVRSKQ